MGHDGHFLERLDRVSRDQTELALELYRDHEAVRHLLDREQVPREAERVAIALGDDGSAPHVIVARDGHFVTCLGPGMSPRPWPVLAKRVLLASLGHASDMRHRRRVAKDIARKGEDEHDLIARLSKRKNMLSREEIVGISAFAPLFAHALYAISAQRAVTVVQAAMLSEHPPKTGVERHARQVWAAAYGIELAGTVEERVVRKFAPGVDDGIAFSTAASHLSNYTFVLRGIWAAGVVGPSLIPSYLARFDCARSSMKALDACLALATIALRHEAARDEVLSVLSARRTVSHGTKLDRAYEWFVRYAIDTVEKPESTEATARRAGAVHYFELAGQRGLTAGVDGHVASPDEVPADLAETAYLNVGGSLELDPEAALEHFFGALPLLAKVSVGAFHYPGRLVKALLEPWGEADVREHYRQLRAATGVKAPVKYDAKIARNDPCPCGSGKKFKRCCAE